jgi:stearoyl-CoA desaturase (Delta-9 desaturase)
VRDHRVHHKYSETDADPHDVRRGFFFAHFGWFLCEKHPQVTEKGKLLDLSDVTNCPIATFHDKYVFLLIISGLWILVDSVGFL